MAEYQYEPLPRNSKWIRVLDLFSAAVFTAPIRCRLRAVSIDTDLQVPFPSYKALSYAWAEQHASPLQSPLPAAVPIFCNEQVLKVPPNLLYALFRLRSQHASKPLTLWADSVCINQADSEERSQQVALMRDIYNRSEEVIIWLGETIPLHEAADVPRYYWAGGRADKTLCTDYMDTLWLVDERVPSTPTKPDERTSALALSLSKSIVPSLTRGDLNDSLENGSSQVGTCDYYGAFCVLSLVCSDVLPAAIPFYGPQGWELDRWFSRAQNVKAALWALVDRLWWKRTWIVQECVLAKKATILYGNMQTPWNTFVIFAKKLVRSQDADDRSNIASGPLHALARLIMTIESARLLLAEGHFPSLLQVLQQFRHCEASDPRDKVFGLLGLLHESTMEADYSRTAETVFILTALNIIKSTRRLDLLVGARPDSIMKIPSWCVDWHSPVGENEWQRLKCLDLYNACGNLEADVAIHKASHGLLLEVNGYSVGRVETVCSDPAPETGFARFKATHERWLREIGQQVSQNQFWRTLCADIFYVGMENGVAGDFCRAPADGARHYAVWRRDDQVFQNRKSSVYGGQLRGDGGMLGNLTDTRNRFSYAMQIMTGGRRMFSMANGQIGVGPPTTQAGDIIVIVPGSNVPLLLRENHDAFCQGLDVSRLTSARTCMPTEPTICSEKHGCHLLVGDMFVLGLMDGEAVECNSTGRFSGQAETFYIC